MYVVQLYECRTDKNDRNYKNYRSFGKHYFPLCSTDIVIGIDVCVIRTYFDYIYILSSTAVISV